jgi:hypothetical protein
MSYEIKYTGSRKEMLDKAYKDACDYVGGEKVLEKSFEIIREDWESSIGFKEKKKCIRSAAFGLSFAGIQGFPVKAIMKVALAQKNS